ncbi:hypothetical protein B0J11DRAFT_227187 [Dendryphion nanum]|uniref:Secreted protein n=1 Tax=Dendryphion nanum TaxID=256645 RepID=A0A9P9E6Q8_9PLEO|nr:hypothetical protein B0J11DRAFT_227187 [Dendryphion nanum]
MHHHSIHSIHSSLHSLSILALSSPYHAQSISPARPLSPLEQSSLGRSGTFRDGAIAPQHPPCAVRRPPVDVASNGVDTAACCHASAARSSHAAGHSWTGLYCTLHTIRSYVYKAPPPLRTSRAVDSSASPNARYRQTSSRLTCRPHLCRPVRRNHSTRHCFNPFSRDKGNITICETGGLS